MFVEDFSVKCGVPNDSSNIKSWQIMIQCSWLSFCKGHGCLQVDCHASKDLNVYTFYKGSSLRFEMISL